MYIIYYILYIHLLKNFQRKLLNAYVVCIYETIRYKDKECDKNIWWKKWTFKFRLIFFFFLLFFFINIWNIRSQYENKKINICSNVKSFASYYLYIYFYYGPINIRKNNNNNPKCCDNVSTNYYKMSIIWDKIWFIMKDFYLKTVVLNSVAD